ncbi:hypothetical protein GS399_05015 [Pedobacter sp. HMF7647]|uniref:Uncharacterized protein n=1 Tax=Hufsiella arboris TaxID=2695275 RepID=A0A7K1Y6X9_9SPHI|nr:hypothetical protein [Hufsiella arboris]MXV50324.1 hypothetical protein [Hufsiella arboris]
MKTTTEKVALFLILLAGLFSACQKTELKNESQVLLSAGKNLATIKSAETVTVDFSVASSPVQYKASGLLHALLPSAMAISPPDLYVLPIKPKYARVTANEAALLVNRHKKLKLTTIVVLSDGWDYSGAHGWPGDPNYDAWQKVVHDQVYAVKNAGYNLDSVHFDIWNEANGRGFWNPTMKTDDEDYNYYNNQTTVTTNRNRFFDMFAFTVNYLHRLSDTIQHKIWIEGPSLTDVAFRPDFERPNGPSFPFIRKWISYVKTNNVAPDYLTWHFPGTSSVNPSVQIDTIRNIWGANVPPVIINEFVDDKRLCNWQ